MVPWSLDGVTPVSADSQPATELRSWKIHCGSTQEIDNYLHWVRYDINYFLLSGRIEVFVCCIGRGWPAAGIGWQESYHVSVMYATTTWPWDNILPAISISFHINLLWKSIVPNPNEWECWTISMTLRTLSNQSKLENRFHILPNLDNLIQFVWLRLHDIFELVQHMLLI